MTTATTATSEPQAPKPVVLSDDPKVTAALGKLRCDHYNDDVREAMQPFADFARKFVSDLSGDLNDDQVKAVTYLAKAAKSAAGIL